MSQPMPPSKINGLATPSCPKNQLPLRGVAGVTPPVPQPETTTRVSTGDWMQAQARYQAAPRRPKPDYAALARRRK
jgi:hypothetical protein